MSALLSDRDKSLVRNFLLGGAGLGGGAALATALVNYLKHLNKNTNEDDDDTIRIYKVPKEQEKVAMSLGGPLALTGGVLGAAGTYAIVNKLYELLRKKQAQEELDKAQNIFIESQGYKKVKKKNDEGTEKKASGQPLSLGEAAMSFPLALPLLMALGSGVVAHKMLNKSFPVKKKKVQAPKRIEIVDAPTEEELEEIKSANIKDSDGVEFLMRAVAMNKKATSDLRNILAATAEGRLSDFKKAAKAIGYANALDTVKGAAKAHTEDPFADQVAISCLSKSSSVGPQSEILAACEFAEAYPSFYKTAAALSETQQDSLFKIACILGKAIRSEIAEAAGITHGAMLTKKAEASEDLLEALLERGDDVIPDSTNDTNKSSDMSKEEGNVKHKKKFTYSSKRGLALAKAIQDDDAIDRILQPKQEHTETI